MKIGDVSAKYQRLVRKTDRPSTTHRFAKIWVLECIDQAHRYGSNSCDAHIRRCPFCDPTAARSEPI